MSKPSISAIVTSAWESAIREMAVPGTDLFHALFAYTAPTYRERLDRQPVNARGEVIPRIAAVRRNIRRLGKPRVPPRLP